MPGRDRAADRENPRDDRWAATISESQFNRVTQSKRQPGSAFKPVTYLAALEETLEGGPDHFLPTSYIEDAPFTWQIGETSWTPKNFKNRYFGRVTLEFALEESLNSATSRLANAIGLDRVRAMAAKLGFGDLPPYPSIVLGGIEVAPDADRQRLRDPGATRASNVPPYAVTAVVDQNSKVIEGHELKAGQVLSPRARLHHGFHARAGDQSRHRRGRSPDGLHTSRGGQDRDDQRFDGRMVRGLHAESD